MPSERKPTQAELADRYGCSTGTIKAYKKAGIDIYDRDAFMAQWRGSGSGKMLKEQDDLDPITEGITYEEGRRRKVAAEARLKEHQVEVAAGKYIASEIVRQDMLRVGGAMKSGLLRLESDLPPILAGLGEAEIQKKIRTALDSLLLEFSKATSELYQ